MWSEERSIFSDHISIMEKSMAIDQDERYFQILPDVQLEKARMDEAFDELDALDKKQIRATARELPVDTEAEFGTAIKGLGHYGLLELMNALALFDAASEATGQKSPDLRDATTVKKAFGQGETDA